MTTRSSVPSDEPSVDEGSFRLGMIAAFAEAVRAGVKKLAFSPPFDPSELDRLRSAAEEIAKLRGVCLELETNLVQIDLFRPEIARGKHVLLIYRDAAVLERYHELKRRVAEVAEEGAKPFERHEFARELGRLLGYRDDRIEEMIAGVTATAPSTSTRSALTPLEARALFPGLADKTFLNSAAVGLLPRPAEDAVRDLLEVTSRMPGPVTKHHLELDRRRRLAGPAIANLLRAKPEEIALVESTTHGLNIVAASLPLRRGDSIVVPETEFLQLGVTWVPLAARLGLKVRFLRTRDGRFSADDIAAEMDRRTRVVCMSSVQWTTGFRADLKAIGRMCRARGAYLLIDAIQHVGAAGLDVNETPVDFIACGGHKWLNAPLGCGFLYVRKALLRKLRPPVFGLLALAEPREGWDVYWRRPNITPNRAYNFPRAAQVFEIGGTANYAGGVALHATVNLVNRIGIDRVEAHIQTLVDQLIDGLDRLGITVISPRERDRRAGIVCFRAYTDPERDWELVQHLLDKRIFVSMRYTAGVGGIRVSIHYFNTEDEIARLLKAVHRYTAAHPAVPARRNASRQRPGRFTT